MQNHNGFQAERGKRMYLYKILLIFELLDLDVVSVY